MSVVRTSISFPKEMKDQILKLAKKDSRTLSSYIQKILHNHIVNNADSSTGKDTSRSFKDDDSSANPDRLNLECPGCESFVPVTTYTGPCENVDFSVDESPLAILAEVNEESREERVQCQSCGMHLALVVKFIAYEKQLSVQQRFNRKWRKE